MLIITPQMIADAPENPSENVILASNNGVIFARIRGENRGLWQINAPQYNGKTYILIFPELYANAGYTSYEEE
ncbi:MAG: hypothetical protein WBC91_11115 [Phototrophicaceae bacterium]